MTAYRVCKRNAGILTANRRKLRVTACRVCKRSAGILTANRQQSSTIGTQAYEMSISAFLAQLHHPVTVLEFPRS
ncbi:hypothetical protein PL8927_710074 [Planktothrix serta PCC 8927]|uniref:Uncharacterized protein n=1 Tax=Planktothrix serta PCC 8927 TaxID=671068 RepID=A0A7Z9BUH0_9CYAN|nr:hypothetical protein PL8927_710074 [Planktothrix serta PCC 8927]